MIVDLHKRPCGLTDLSCSNCQLPAHSTDSCGDAQKAQTENFRTVFVPLAHGLASLTFFAYKRTPSWGKVQSLPILHDSTFYNGSFYFCSAKSLSNKNIISWSVFLLTLHTFFVNIECSSFSHLANSVKLWKEYSEKLQTYLCREHCCFLWFLVGYIKHLYFIVHKPREKASIIPHWWK